MKVAVEGAIFLSLISYVVSSGDFPVATWSCIPISTKTLSEGVVWNTHNCTKDASVSPPLLVINSIHVDMTRDDIRIVPAIADPVAQVQSLPQIAAQNENFIAGINGGYFWRVDIDGWWRDNVCKGKTRSEAEQSASSQNVNYGISDGQIIANGEVLGNNCNCTGFSRPAVLGLDGVDSGIQVLYRGENLDPSVVPNAIGAGPNLVSLNFETGESYIDVPKDDDNVNKLVYEATTAVGLVQTIAGGKATTSSLVMVTSDGSDSCMPKDKYCGILSPDLASLMIQIFGCSQAMSMDQGGSTTMWIDGENPTRNGIVSRSDNTQSEATEGARNLANGLFIEKI
jgi:exopolysaccharide biosynthesis protein